MSILRLGGLFSKEAEFGSEFYYVIQLTSTDLNLLATFLQSHLEIAASYQVHIGQGHLCFEAISDNSFTVERTEEDVILLRAMPSELARLGSRLQEMARAESAPDYLVHVHLETYFTSPGKGLSDVVFQRLDEYHKGGHG